MRFLAALLVALTVAGTAGCRTEAGPAIDPVGAMLVDVRTPAEYAEGHLEGALNIDAQEPGFVARAAEELDAAGSYILYCRTGTRSAAAAEQLRALGFTDVVDAGGLEEAARATGLPVVTE